MSVGFCDEGSESIFAARTNPVKELTEMILYRRTTNK
jgi:hypothetical protein